MTMEIDPHMEMCITFAQSFEDYLNRRATLDRPGAEETWRELKERNPSCVESGAKTLSKEEAQLMAAYAASHSSAHVLWIPLKCPHCGDKAVMNFFRTEPGGPWNLDTQVALCKKCEHWFYSADALDKEEDFGKSCFILVEQIREAKRKLGMVAEPAARKAPSAAPTSPARSAASSLPAELPAPRQARKNEDKPLRDIMWFILGLTATLYLLTCINDTTEIDVPFGAVWLLVLIVTIVYLACKFRPGKSTGNKQAVTQVSPSSRMSAAPAPQAPGRQTTLPAAPAKSSLPAPSERTIETPEGTVILEEMVTQAFFPGGNYIKERYRGRTLKGKRVTVVIRRDNEGNSRVSVTED